VTSVSIILERTPCGGTTSWCDDERMTIDSRPRQSLVPKQADKDSEDEVVWMTNEMLREISAVSRSENILGYCTLKEALDDSLEDWRNDRYWDIRKDAHASDTSEYSEAPSDCSNWESGDDSDYVDAI
jgi:hypothetical protein